MVKFTTDSLNTDNILDDILSHFYYTKTDEISQSDHEKLEDYMALTTNIVDVSDDTLNALMSSGFKELAEQLSEMKKAKIMLDWANLHL